MLNPLLEQTRPSFTSYELACLKALANSMKEYGMVEEILFSMAQYHKMFPNGSIQDMVWYVTCEWDL